MADMYLSFFHHMHAGGIVCVTQIQESLVVLFKTACMIKSKGNMAKCHEKEHAD